MANPGECDCHCSPCATEMHVLCQPRYRALQEEQTPEQMAALPCQFDLEERSA